MKAASKKLGLNRTETKILAKGVDSLYLYLESGEVINWKNIIDKIERYSYDEPFYFRGLSFVRVKVWMKSYPVCIRHNQFMFFINRTSLYIKVLSLAFELKGFEGVIILLCKVLDQLIYHKNQGKWLDCLKVSRIDVYVDFAYEGEFNISQFRTKLRKKGFFKSGENSEAITYYFGSRDLLLIRLYVKSEEIKSSGKEYLKSHWKQFDCQDSRIWRLEFEFHKEKILELCRFRELSFINQGEVEKLFAYGMGSLEYVTEPDRSGNIYRKPLPPIWKALKTEFNTEYKISKNDVYKADLNYRFKRAKRCVISWLIAQGSNYDEIEQFYIDKFKINRYDYEEALKKQRWIREV